MSHCHWPTVQDEISKDRKGIKHKNILKDINSVSRRFQNTPICQKSVCQNRPGSRNNEGRIIYKYRVLVIVIYATLFAAHNMRVNKICTGIFLLTAVLVFDNCLAHLTSPDHPGKLFGNSLATHPDIIAKISSFMLWSKLIFQQIAQTNIKCSERRFWY